MRSHSRVAGFRLSFLAALVLSGWLTGAASVAAPLRPAVAAAPAAPRVFVITKPFGLHSGFRLSIDAEAQRGEGFVAVVSLLGTRRHVRPTAAGFLSFGSMSRVQLGGHELQLASCSPAPECPGPLAGPNSARADVFASGPDWTATYVLVEAEKVAFTATLGKGVSLRVRRDRFRMASFDRASAAWPSGNLQVGNDIRLDGAAHGSIGLAELACAEQSGTGWGSATLTAGSQTAGLACNSTEPAVLLESGAKSYRLSGSGAWTGSNSENLVVIDL